jgi:hypothetical protein
MSLVLVVLISLQVGVHYFTKLIRIWEHTSFQTIVEKNIWPSMKPPSNDSDKIKIDDYVITKFSLRVGQK